MSSFSIKRLETRITLASGSFGGMGNTMSIRGLATEASVEKNGLPDFGKAAIRIWGMNYDAMDKLTTLAAKPFENRNNRVELYAGDEGGEMSLVFRGEIDAASADFNGAPEVVFSIGGVTGSYPMQQSSGARAISGAAPLGDIVRQIAGMVGYAFRNEGVSAQLSNAYLEGSPMEQAMRAVKEAGAELIVDDGTMVLLPRGAARSGRAILLSAETGLRGYPSFTNNGLAVTCLYNPELRLGGLVEIKSIVPKASALWRITKLSHQLAAYTPGQAPWDSKLEAMPLL